MIRQQVRLTTESWVPYMGATEAWADSYKFGIRPERMSDFQTVEQYYAAFGLSRIFN